jgi:O-antigen ligase
LIIAKGKIQKPQGVVLIALIYYVALFIFASMTQWELTDLWVRRLISFLIFLTTFTFVFIGIKSSMIDGFKGGVVLVSTFLSLKQIITFVLRSAGGPLHFEAKDLVGSQRLGFVYVVAIWLCVVLVPRSWKWRIVKYSCLTSISLGTALTFSRASVIALLGSVVLFSLWSVWQWFSRPSRASVRRLTGVLISLGILVGTTYHFLPVTVEFYSIRLLDSIQSGRLRDNLSNPATSEGARAYIWETVVEYILKHPVIGNGYLGVWAILGEDIAGSAHNQYVDVLLRTGIIGFGIYCWLLWRIAYHLYRRDRALFWGFCGFLLYGLFHETAKESQGTAMLAFLLGMTRRQIVLRGCKQARIPLPSS